MSNPSSHPLPLRDSRGRFVRQDAPDVLPSSCVSSVSRGSVGRSPPRGVSPDLLYSRVVSPRSAESLEGESVPLLDSQSVDFEDEIQDLLSFVDPVEDPSFTRVTKRTARSHREQRSSQESVNTSTFATPPVVSAIENMSPERLLEISARFGRLARAGFRARAGDHSDLRSAEVESVLHKHEDVELGSDNKSPLTAPATESTPTPGLAAPAQPPTSLAPPARAPEAPTLQPAMTPPSPGPSKMKGKGFDPRNFGGIDWSVDMSETELDAQRMAYQNLNHNLRPLKEESKSKAFSNLHLLDTDIANKNNVGDAPLLLEEPAERIDPQKNEGKVHFSLEEQIANLQQHIQRLEDQQRHTDEKSRQRASSKSATPAKSAELSRGKSERPVDTAKEPSPRKRSEKPSSTRLPGGSFLDDLVRRSKEVGRSSAPPSDSSDSSSSDPSSDSSSDSDPSNHSSESDSEGSLADSEESDEESAINHSRKSKKKTHRKKSRMLLRPHPPKKYDGSANSDKYIEFVDQSTQYLKLGRVDPEDQVAMLNDQEKVVKLWVSLREDIQTELWRKGRDPEATKWKIVVKSAERAERFLSLKPKRHPQSQNSAGQKQTAPDNSGDRPRKPYRRFRKSKKSGQTEVLQTSAAGFSEVYETLQVGSVGIDFGLEEGENTHETFDSKDDPIGDLPARWAEIVLEHLGQDPSWDGKRFLVYGISDTHHVVVDAMLNTSFEICSEQLRDPHFQIGMWIAQRIQTHLELDPDDVPREEPYVDELGDPYQAMAAITLGNDDFEVGNVSNMSYRVQKSDGQQSTLAKSSLEDQSFSLKAWAREAFISPEQPSDSGALELREVSNGPKNAQYDSEPDLEDIPALQSVSDSSDEEATDSDCGSECSFDFFPTSEEERLDEDVHGPNPGLADGPINRDEREGTDRYDQTSGQYRPMGDLLAEGARAFLETFQPYPGDDLMAVDNPCQTRDRFKVLRISRSEYLIWDELSHEMTAIPEKLLRNPKFELAGWSAKTTG
ncbi:unnamed protein product [Mycena citricolor]|uniref:Uncharacterized protein n=1 Tax=Mycena citricolor TaxID=2018698 RepID=A0AAD2H076_9AGAR|nr:unnamed protein product [Mycena citricolor]